MKKSLSQVLILSAALLLASCQKPGDSKAPESEASATSQIESTPDASEAGTSTPTGSTSTPAGTSTPTASSSRPAGTSTPAGSSAAAEMVYTPGGADIVIESNKTYLKFTGTLTGVTGDAAKFAFGLQHTANQQIGYVDPDDGQWLVGSATPAAADYKYTPTIDAQGNFEVKVEITGVQFIKGSYTMFVGPQGGYAAIAVGQANYGQGTSELNGTKLIFRGDQNLLVAEELPPIHLTEETVEIDTENNKAYIKVGGELTITEAAFNALDIKVSFEKQVGGWSKTPKTGEDVIKVVEGTKGYVKVDITDLGEGGYQVKIGFDGQSEPNTTMECESYDMRETPFVLGTKAYAPYFSAGGSGADTLYGCCGLFISHHHNMVDTKSETSALHTVACSANDLSYYELRAAEATTGQKTPSETETDDNAKKTRLGKNNIFDDVWDITGIASGEYEIYLEARASAGNASKGYWNSATAIANGDQAGNNGSTAALQGDYKYKVKIDSGEYVNLGNDTDNYAAVGLAEDAKHWTNKALATVMISGDATSLTVHNMNNGYALWVYGVRLVRVGNYIKPATQVTFTENVMRIEAEDTHGYPINNKSGTITAEGEGEDFSGDKIVAGLGYQSGGWNSSAVAGQLDFIMKATEARAIKVKVHLKSNQTTSQKVASLSLNGTKVADISAADTWTDSTSEAFNMPAGEFTLSIKGVNANYTADIDYIEILDQGAPLHEHTLVDGTAAQNTSGKDVIPFECSGCHKKGAKIAVTDFEGESSASIDSNNSDGSFKPKKVDIAYKLIVPETGYYTISLGMLISSNTTRAMSDRHFIVKLGETTLPLTLDGTATPESLGIATSGDPTDVILAGAQLEAGEVTISINNSDYRVGFKGYVSIMQAEAPAS